MSFALACDFTMLNSKPKDWFFHRSQIGPHAYFKFNTKSEIFIQLTGQSLIKHTHRVFMSSLFSLVPCLHSSFFLKFSCFCIKLVAADSGWTGVSCTTNRLLKPNSYFFCCGSSALFTTVSVPWLSFVTSSILARLGCRVKLESRDFSSLGFFFSIAWGMCICNVWK